MRVYEELTEKSHIESHMEIKKELRAKMLLICNLWMN